MKQPLTQAQQRVLDVIKAHIKEQGYPPTRREISAALGFKSSYNAAHDHLAALERKGVIQLVPNVSRGIRLVPGIDDAVGITSKEGSRRA